MTDQMLRNKSLSEVKKLATGNFGPVYTGTYGKVRVAIKQLDLTILGKKIAGELKRENRAITKLNHASLIKIHKIFVNSNFYTMVMDFMPNADLYHHLHIEKKLPPWNRRWDFAVEIASGIAYLHYSHILHHNLNSHNIFIDKDFHAKITDFGLGRLKLKFLDKQLMNNGEMPAELVAWTAPEIFDRFATKGPPADVYSFAHILWELATGLVPYSDCSSAGSALAWLIRGGKQSTPILDSSPQEFTNIICKCWVYYPEKRLTAKQALKQLEAARPKSENPKPPAQAKRHQS